MVLSPNVEEVASSKNIPNSRLKCTNHALFQTKRAKKILPFGAAHTYIASIRGYPPRPGLYFTFTENPQVLAFVDGENSTVVHPNNYH